MVEDQHGSKKYVSRKDDKVLANCPFCRGVIFRDFKIDEDLHKWSFLMRCPHCRKDVPVAFADGGVAVGEAGSEKPLDDPMGTEDNIADHKESDQKLWAHIKEMETLNKLMVERELKMVELKREVAELRRKLSEREEL